MKNPVESLLEDDHASLDQLFVELDLALTKPSVARGFELLDLFWARLAVHIRAEHLHLFPALSKAAPEPSGKSSMPSREEVDLTLARLRSDHDFFMKGLAQLMKEARESGTGAGDFRKRLAAIRKRLETHNQIEERQVYLWPSLLLDETTVAALEERVRLELENMPPRLAAETQ
ncbi:MAG: hemerythrin domain-containing protein [Acidobacteriota bacterium]